MQWKSDIQFLCAFHLCHPTENKQKAALKQTKYINIIDNMSLITEKVLHFTETLG